MHVNCPHCHHGIEIVADACLTEIDCPSCGSSFNILGDDADATLVRDSGVTKSIGRFQLLSEVGVGAFGSVWLGKDVQLDRQVAVKIPRKGQLNATESEQFFREARAAAQLKHPNIVPVHEIGRDGETIYIVSEFVQGMSLADRLTAGPMGMQESAELCITVARALEHAHEKGVIHRDLKPSNIMLDEHGQPHVMDFGLAKRDTGEITMTVDGQVLGTPSYMSPEQARGSAHDADGRSDLYSVGVILFQLLTGELPFRGNTRMLIHQVINDEAPSPLKLNSNIDKDLATITSKCLEKDPDKRYVSADDLANDLQRYRDGHPISARPISSLERSWRWCKRRPMVGGLSALLLLALMLGTFVSMYFAIQANKRTRQAHTQLIQLYSDRGLAEAEKGATGNAALWFAKAILTAEESDFKVSTAAYLNRVRLANYAARAPVLFDMIPLDQRQNWLELSENGQHFLTNSKGRNCQLWHLSTDGADATMRLRLHSVNKCAFLANGTRIGIVQQFEGEDSSCCVYDTGNGKAVIEKIGLKNSNPDSTAFCSRGDVFVADGTVFSLPSGDPTGTIPELDICENLTISPDGRRIFGLVGNQGRIWDARSLATVGEPIDFTAGNALVNNLGGAKPQAVSKSLTDLERVVFSLDGEILVCLHRPQAHSQLGWIDVFRVTTGERITKKRVEGNASFSGDGKWLAIRSGRQVQLLDLSNDAAIVTELPHPRKVTSVEFNKSGDGIVTCCKDGTARIWNVLTVASDNQLKPIQTGFLRHPNSVNRAVFTPDGRWIVSIGKKHWFIWEAKSSELVSQMRITGSLPSLNDDRSTDLTAMKVSSDGRWMGLVTLSGFQRWELVAGHELRHSNIDGVAIATKPITRAQLARDGSLLVTGHWDGTAQVWDIKTGNAISPALVHGDVVVSVDISPDGLRVATASWDGTARIWDAHSGDPLCDPILHPAPLNAVKFSPDGQQVATTAGNLCSIYEVPTGKRHAQMACRHGIYNMEFRNDGRQLLTASVDDDYDHGGIDSPVKPKCVRIWDVDSGNLKMIIPVVARYASFSDDGDWVITFAGDSAQVWDSKTGQAVGKPMRHSDRIVHASFSPDGTLVATTSFDETARIWNAQTGQPVTNPLQHDHIVSSAGFSPNGSQVVTGCLDGTARIWDTRVGEPLSSPLKCDGEVGQVRFVGDGMVMTVDSSHVRTWIADQEVAFQSSATTLLEWTEKLTGSRIEDGGKIRPLTANEWQRLEPTLPRNDTKIYGEKRSVFFRSRALDYALTDQTAAEAHAKRAEQLVGRQNADLLGSVNTRPDEVSTTQEILPRQYPTLLSGTWHCPCANTNQYSIPDWASGNDPFDVAEFLSNRMPTSNPDARFVAALAELGGETWRENFQSHFLVNHNLGIPRDETFEYLQDFWDKINEGVQLSPAELRQIDRMLARAENCIKGVDEVTKQPSWIHVNGLTLFQRVPATQESRKVSLLLGLKAYRRIVQGRLDEAIDCFEQNLRLSRGLSRRGFVVQQLVSNRIEELTYPPLVDLLGNSELTPSQCDRLTKLLREHQEISVDSLAEMLRLDYIMLRNVFEQVLRGDMPLGFVLERFGSGSDRNWTASSSSDLEYVRKAPAALDDWFKMSEPYMRRPYTYLRQFSLQQRHDQFMKRTQNPILQASLVGSPNIMRYFVRVEATRSNAIALAAIQKWKLTHGQLPESLDAAVKESGLSSPPIDPYSNKSVKYRIIDGKAVVYCIGPDQKDDGGLRELSEWGPESEGDLVLCLE